MNEAYPLFADQDDHGGSSACCVIACYIAKHTLLWNEKPQRRQIDRIVQEGAQTWCEMQTGFLSPDQVLAQRPELAMLRIRDTYHALVTGEMRDEDGHLLAHDARTVVIEWLQDHDGDSVAVVTRSAYTFTIFVYDSIYYIVDSHKNVLTQRKAAIDKTMRLQEESKAATGAMLLYYFPKDVANYVVNFLPATDTDPRRLVTSNELEISIIELKPKGDFSEAYL